MGKPLNNFGGWLVFFFISLWGGIILYLISLFNLITLFYKAESWYRIIYSILIIDITVSLILVTRVVQIVRIKNIEIPGRINRILSWFFILTAGLGLCEIIVSYLLFSSSASKFIVAMAKSIFKTIVWVSIWSNYFKKSQRVFAYYGKNAIAAFQIKKNLDTSRPNREGEAES